MARKRRGTYDGFTIDCGSEDFAAIVHDYMEEHCWDVDDDVTQAAGDAGEKAARLLRERSRKRKGGGAYAKDWVAEAKPTEAGVEVVVHNRRHYMLTHLLEKGHAIANQHGTYDGRVAGDNVIATTADETADEFLRRIQS